MENRPKSLALTSIDVSFAFIALAKDLISKEQHRAVFEEILTLRARDVSTTMEEILSRKGLLDRQDCDRVAKTQFRHMRICVSCQRKTYRLPNQKKGEFCCEYCRSPVREPTAAERLVFETLRKGKREKPSQKSHPTKDVKFRESHDHLKKFLESKRATVPVRFVKPVRPGLRKRVPRRP